MMSSNWLVSLSRPLTLSVYWNACPAGVGGAPIWPAVTCWLCCWIEETTSCGIKLRTCNLFGSSQIRIEYCPAPNTVTLPTPGSRDSSSLMLMVA